MDNIFVKTNRFIKKKLSSIKVLLVDFDMLKIQTYKQIMILSIRVTLFV